MTSSDRSEGNAIMLRDARETDLRAILNLLADDPLGKHREPAVPENAGIPSEYEAAFEAIATDHRNQLVVAEIGGRIVGCFQLIFIRGLTHRGGVWATIAGVRVAQAMRGRGIGKAMMQDAIARSNELRERLRATSFTDIVGSMPVTVSIGVAHGLRPVDAGALSRAADRCLYDAKRAGRDQAIGAVVG